MIQIIKDIFESKKYSKIDKKNVLKIFDDILLENTELYFAEIVNVNNFGADFNLMKLLSYFEGMNENLTEKVPTKVLKIFNLFSPPNERAHYYSFDLNLFNEHKNIIKEIIFKDNSLSNMKLLVDYWILFHNYSYCYNKTKLRLLFEINNSYFIIDLIFKSTTKQNDGEVMIDCKIMYNNKTYTLKDINV